MTAQYSCLVVEDSPMMRQLLVLALSRLKSLRVTEADDGVDGLRKLATGKFDIVLTDINMPIMDGLKLVKRVRTDPNHKDVPIIVITTEGSTEDRQLPRHPELKDPGVAAGDLTADGRDDLGVGPQRRAQPGCLPDGVAGEHRRAG